MCDSDGECSISARGCPRSPRVVAWAHRRRADRGRRRRDRAAGFARRHAPPVVRRRRPVAAAARRPRHPGVPDVPRALRQPRSAVCRLHGAGGPRDRRVPRRDRRRGWTALRSAPEIARVDAGVVDRARDFGWLADRQLLLLHGRRARRGAAAADARRDARRGRRAPRAADGAVAGGRASWCARIPPGSSTCCVTRSAARRRASASASAPTAT